MSVDMTTNYNQDSIRAYSKKHNEPTWMRELREAALKKAQEARLPKLEKTRINDWDVDHAPTNTEEDIVQSIDELPEGVRRFVEQGDEAGNVIVHRNGKPVLHALKKELADQGVIFTDFQSALREHGDLIQPYFMKRLASVDDHKISALHAALVNCGVFLYVPRNVEVQVPLQTIFWQDEQGASTVPHVCIIAEANSKVTYMENAFDTSDKRRVHNYIAEVFVAEGARVTFAAVDQLSANTTSYVYRYGQVERDGRVEWALGQMNDGNTVSDNTTFLDGDGATGDTKSVVVGRGEQSQNFVQKMVQSGLATDGQMLSHAVMKDESRAIFNGITKIEKGATKANGEQTERVLMLSDRARGDANPILLIDEDDVTAGHAASVGQVDELQLYYLMSRGISRKEAEKLIILGFLAPVVENIPLENVKARLLEVIERKVI